MASFQAFEATLDTHQKCLDPMFAVGSASSILSITVFVFPIWRDDGHKRGGETSARRCPVWTSSTHGGFSLGLNPLSEYGPLGMKVGAISKGKGDRSRSGFGSTSSNP